MYARWMGIHSRLSNFKMSCLGLKGVGMNLEARLQQVNNARKAAQNSDAFEQQVEEHARAIERENHSATPPSKQRKKQSKKMSDLFSGSKSPMY